MTDQAKLENQMTFFCHLPVSWRWDVRDQKASRGNDLAIPESRGQWYSRAMVSVQAF